MLDTINWLALTVPFIAAGTAYMTLREKLVAKVLAGIVALGILAMVFVGYSFLYRHLGFPFWMRWLASAAHAEPLPGRPEVRINTKLDADWTILGMNYDWMLLVAKVHVPMGPIPEFYMRWEFTKPKNTDEGKPFLSEVQIVELDCKLTRSNVLAITSYAGNNLSGANVYSGHGNRADPLWDTPAPKSIGAAAIRKSCELLGK
jgi:hypothetical protein